MPALVDPTSRTTQASLRHISLVEQAVNRYSPLIWARTVRQLMPWLKRTLAAIRPQVTGMVLEQRVYEFEKLYLQSVLEGLRLTDAPPELGPLVQQFGDQVALQYGFLPSDPRREDILRYTTGILRDDLSSFWSSLTDPQLLATRLVNLRAQGLSYVEMSQQIANQYQTEFYRAERLVRSAYNASSNYSHYTDLVSLYEQIRWLTARDPRVRGGRSGNRFNHRRADGQTVTVGQPFIVSGEQLMFPGDRSRGASAGNLVNCRCTLVGVESRPKAAQAKPAPPPRPMSPPLDLQNSELSRYNQRVDDRRDSIGKAGSSLYDYYLDKIFAGDEAQFKQVRKFSDQWTRLYAKNPEHSEMRDAWQRVFAGNEPQNQLEQDILDIYTSRPERWARLARELEVDAPEQFTAWRGVKGRDMVEEVATAWRDDSSLTMNVPTHELSSWSLSLESAESFMDRKMSVRFEAEVPFEFSLADKWADDGNFIYTFHDEHELVVALPQPNALETAKHRVVVVVNGREYRYHERDELIAQLAELE